MDIIINKKPISLPILPILALIALLILGLSSARVASVGGDEVGVFVNNLTGKISVKLTAGSSVYNGIYTDFYTLKKTERTIKMNKSDNDLRFLFVGDGKGMPAFKAAVSHLGDRVILTGNVPHSRVPGLVALLDIGVLPGTAPYTSPLKILEWMAAGVAIVAPRHPPIEELLVDGVHGLLFEPGDCAAFIERAMGLAGDAELRRRLGEAARERVLSSFTWRHNARGVLAACEQAQAEFAKD